MSKIFLMLREVLFFVLFFGLTLYGSGETDDYVKETTLELGIDINGNITENSFKYYKKMFGEHFEFKKTRYVTLRRACSTLPMDPDKMDLFEDMMIAPYIPFPYCDNVSYLTPKYLPDHKTLDPKKYYLAKSPLLSDMLYWEWSVDDFQFRKLETYNGMLLFITPKDFDPIKGISSTRCIEVLMQVTRINCDDPEELQKQFNFPPTLYEGDVFSNIPNFDKMTHDFPFPTDTSQWRKEVVGLITKDAICLILVHGRLPRQSFPLKPTIIDDTRRWLSGRILYKSTKKPVLPRGVTQMPESWKPALENNAKWEKWGLKQAEQRRIEESKWRVWHDKNGKPLFDGKKMKLAYWHKPSIPFVQNLMGHTPDQNFKSGSVTMEIRNEPKFVSLDFPLSEFSAEDKKLILETPPMKFNESEPTVVGSSNDKELLKPKTSEPEPDDIE